MQTKVSSAIWSDPDLEDAPPEIKLTVFWLLTNERRNCLGWVEVSKRRFEYETGLPSANLEGACKVLARGLVKFERGIWIRNFIRFQYGVGHSLARSNMKITLLKHLSECPETDVVQAVKQTYPELFESVISKSPLQAPSKGLPSPKEKEKENTKEKDKEQDLRETNPAAWSIQIAKERIGAIFQRPANARWSNAEEHALSALWPMPEEELALVEHLHANFAETLTAGQNNPLKQKLPTLLADWASELDLARNFSAIHPTRDLQKIAKKKSGGAGPSKAQWEPWLTETYPKALVPEQFSDLPTDIQREFNQSIQPSK